MSKAQKIIVFIFSLILGVALIFGSYSTAYQVYYDHNIEVINLFLSDIKVYVGLVIIAVGAFFPTTGTKKAQKIILALLFFIIGLILISRAFIKANENYGRVMDWGIFWSDLRAYLGLLLIGTGAFFLAKRKAK